MVKQGSVDPNAVAPVKVREGKSVFLLSVDDVEIDVIWAMTAIF